MARCVTPSASSPSPAAPPPPPRSPPSRSWNVRLSVRGEPDGHRGAHQPDLGEPEVAHEEAQRREPHVERVPAEEVRAVAVLDLEAVDGEGERERVDADLRDGHLTLQRRGAPASRSRSRTMRRRDEEAEGRPGDEEAADDGGDAEATAAGEAGRRGTRRRARFGGVFGCRLGHASLNTRAGDQSTAGARATLQEGDEMGAPTDLPARRCTSWVPPSSTSGIARGSTATPSSCASPRRGSGAAGSSTGIS